MLLIIEDNDLLAELVGDMCKDITDYMIITSYISLLNLSIETLSNINVILTDWHLDGTHTANDVLEYARTINPDVKIILMTGGILVKDITDNYDDVLYKPFTHDDLVEMLGTFNELQ